MVAKNIQWVIQICGVASMQIEASKMGEVKTLALKKEPGFGFDRQSVMHGFRVASLICFMELVAQTWSD